MEQKPLLKLTFMLTLACINLTFIRPTFSQAKIESYIFSKDNPINGAISITFPDGWSTYWKFPGPNGFTPNVKVLSFNYNNLNNELKNFLDSKIKSKGVHELIFLNYFLQNFLKI